MAIHLHKIVSQPVLHYRFEEPITLHDLAALQAHEQRLFCTLHEEEQAQVIVDMRALDTIPASLFPKLQQMHLATDSRIRLIVVVGANPYLRALTKSLNLLTRRAPMIFCATMDEAFMAIAANVVPDAPPPAVNARET